jgi:RHS repeat-associated protein
MGCPKLTERDFFRLGNRSREGAEKQSVLLAYNNLNQLQTASPAEMGMYSHIAGDYQYDTFGNLISTPKANYRYNLNNRLVEVNSASQRLCGRLSFSYDGNGRRTDKQVFDKDGKLIRHTKFLYSGFKCVAEIDAITGKVEKFYQWSPALRSLGVGGGEQLLGVLNVQKGTQLSCLTDGNKNVIGLMDSNGEISARFAYSPFGKLLNKQGKDADVCSFGFSSEYRDNETGLVYYNYRYYSAELGRWLTRDPILSITYVARKFTLTQLFYVIVSNNPVNNTDKWGLLISCPKNAKIKDCNQDGTCKYRTNKQNGNPSTNGCGGKDMDPKIIWALNHTGGIYWSFVKPCNGHDICYGTCGSSKVSCDLQLLSDSLSICQAYSYIPYLGATCRAEALVFYTAVVGLGETWYNDAQDRYCKWEDCCK